MAQKDEETLEQMIRSWCRQAGRDSDRTDCPADELLAGYAAGELARENAHGVEEHLSRCAFCLDEVVLAKRVTLLEDANVDSVPRRLVDRAQAIAAPEISPDLLDVTIELNDKSMQLLATTGRVLPVEKPQRVRQGSGSGAPDLIRVAEVMGHLRIVLEVQLVAELVCELAVRVESNATSHPGAERVALIRGTRELASFRTQHGVAVFERIPPGRYALAISDADGAAGMIKLNLLESHGH